MAQARDDLGRFLQPPLNLPRHIGPVEFDTVGAMVAVRCPRGLDPLMKKAGGQWEPGSRRWLIVRRRIGPLMRDAETLHRSAVPAGGDGPGRS